MKNETTSYKLGLLETDVDYIYNVNMHNTYNGFTCKHNKRPTEHSYLPGPWTET